MSRLILNSSYYFDDLADIEEDVFDAIRVANVPVDESGVFSGHFKVTIVYEEEDEGE